MLMSNGQPLLPERLFSKVSKEDGFSRCSFSPRVMYGDIIDVYLLKKRVDTICRFSHLPWYTVSPVCRIQIICSQGSSTMPDGTVCLSRRLLLE